MRTAAGEFSMAGIAILVTAAITAKIPLRSMFMRALAVMPFALLFAAFTAAAGKAAEAELMIVRSYLSACAAVLLIATTPMPRLMEGLALLRVPRFLLQVMQFLYRYLSVLTREAEGMRTAAQSRAGHLLRPDWRHAAAMAGVLFGRASSRAEQVHRAMVARGFDGQLPSGAVTRFRLLDAAIALAVSACIVGLRAALP